MEFTKAKDVIEYLYSLPHLHPKNDLSFIKKILAVLDNPQEKIKTIHVTGTNGKGSTSYYLSNLLQKAGLKTGLFVSPYIREFNERIQLNNHNIDDQSLVEIANQIEQAIAKIRQTDSNFNLVTFEYETVIAFLYFAQQRCDYAVIEVGIGGQHDKTNVITPEVSVITTIGLDHEKIIGPTIQDIAHEKSGIIKKQRPVVLGNIPHSVLSILKNKAKENKASIFLLQDQYYVDSNETINYQFMRHHLSFNLRPLVESYDIAIALTAFYLLHLNLSDQKVEAAIDQTIIPGRYQMIVQKPKIILDGAHNIQAMKNLLQFVHENLTTGSNLYCLVMMMKDKDLEQVFSLFNNEDHVLLTSIPYPRAAKKNDFPLDIQNRYNYVEDYHQAYLMLKQKLKPNDVLLVTGSFYLVGAILQMEEANEG